MAGRRNTTPLFEIVSRNGNGQAAPVADNSPERPHMKAVSAASEGAARRTERASGGEGVLGVAPGRSAGPASVPAVAPGREPEAREMPRTMGRISAAGGTLRMPVNYAYIGLSVVLVLALLAWTTGYMVGGRNADEKARREIESATGGGAPRDPLAEGGGSGAPVGGSQPGVGEAGGRQPSPSVARPPAAPQATSAPGPASLAGLPPRTERRTRFLSSDGFFTTDPRTAGLNYFCLVSRLPEADAARAVEFLGRHGVLAVGVEGERSTANNRFFELYTLEGLTREEYAREGGSTRRDAHESMLAELGRRWKAEERGTSDFSRPQWYRFNP